MHVCKREKKRRKGETVGVFEGKQCVRRVCSGREVCTLAKRAICTTSPGQKTFHHHPGMAKKSGHVPHTLSIKLHGKKDSRSLVQWEHHGWSQTGREVTSWLIKQPRAALSSWAAASLVPISLTEEVSALPCTPKASVKHKNHRIVWV